MLSGSKIVYWLPWHCVNEVIIKLFVEVTIGLTTTCVVWC